MNKIGLFILGAALSSTSYALVWNDSTLASNPPPLKFLEGAVANASSSYSSSFNILDNGYNPATMTVTSATATFWFADDDSDGGEQVDIYVNGFKVIANQEVDGAHPQSSFAPYSVSLNSVNDINGLIAALQDGMISYKVQLLNGSNGGDTYLKIAELSVTGTSRTVPDGGMTVVMLGLGMVTLVAARKRLGLTL